MSRSVRDPQTWRGINTQPDPTHLSKEKDVSLTPERREHFRKLCDSPRHNHGTNLNPVPVPVGAMRELLDDGEAVERVRALADYLDTLASGDQHYAACIRQALEGTP